MSYEKIESPKHYNNQQMEVWEMMLKLFGKEKFLAFCQLNSFKYRMRAGLKPGNEIHEDIEKALWYENKINTLKNTNGAESNDLPDNVSSTGGDGHHPVYSYVKDKKRKVEAAGGSDSKLVHREEKGESRPKSKLARRSVQRGSAKGGEEG